MKKKDDIILAKVFMVIGLLCGIVSVLFVSSSSLDIILMIFFILGNIVHICAHKCPICGKIGLQVNSLSAKKCYCKRCEKEIDFY